MEYLKCFLCWDVNRWTLLYPIFPLFWIHLFGYFYLPLLIFQLLSFPLHWMITQNLTGNLRYFRICLCLEIGSKPQEAILYCQKAISVCKARVQRLANEEKSFPDLDKGPHQTSIVSQSSSSMTDKHVEIDTLTGLSVDLEKKVSLIWFVLIRNKHFVLYIFC